MDILFFFLQAIFAVGSFIIMHQTLLHTLYMYQFAFYTLFYCACANELVVNNGNRGEIMEKLSGELWEGRAVDGKLKSSLEWPK